MPLHEKTVTSMKVGFGGANSQFMRSGDLTTRSRNPSEDNGIHGHTSYNNNALKIEGSPLGKKVLKEPSNLTPLLPPMKAPSRTYAYQVSQLSVNE